MCRSFARFDDGHARVLLIHGTTGTGKSHLLSAVESAYRRRRPERPVLHTMAADMAHALADAVRADRMAHVEAAYADVALFIVDDLQALWEARPQHRCRRWHRFGRPVNGGSRSGSVL
jgi:chromosomal replication initiation ATPase DnaA